ncbi:MAG: hypothetical protein FJ150_05260 [Euryarchaeota archaeon]|nr:hypothetical protein [Euryarchaeota archaeon]
MANLFWKTKEDTKSLLSKPFKTEEEFEKIVFDTQEILEDIFLIKRQIRGGNKSGIPDIVGVDYDGNICIVEMKNVDVNSSIIPQVLEYAIWAETNPDGIKNLWLECEEKPDELSISWDDFQVRIIIIAPNILKSTLDFVNKINYHVDLIEVKRWVDEENQFLLVNKLEKEKQGKITVIKGLQTYDLNFYKKEYNKNSAKEFIRYVKEVESIIKKNRWSLDTKYNKHYVSFKAGFFNAFGIKWIGTKTFAFFFKLDEDEVKNLDVKTEITKYDAQWKEAIYYIDPSKTVTKDLKPLFEASYKKLTGQ